MRFALALIVAALLSPVAVAQSTWTAVATVTPPPPAGLDTAVMVYDTARAVTVLYVANSTYEYAGADWQQINTPNSPGIFEGAVAAYDSIRGVVVLHGGSTGSLSSTRTWEYDGADWTSPTNMGPLGPATAMTFDECRGMMVLHHPFSGTWDYDSATTTWTLVSPGGPGQLTTGRLIFDPDLDKSIFVGGTGAIGWATDFQTWQFDGAAAAWTQLVPLNLPAPRDHIAAAYDSSRGLTVVHGGRGSNVNGTGIGPVLEETWAYNSATNTWSADTSAAGPLRRDAVMVFDAARDRLVMFGGLSLLTLPLDNLTYEYEPGFATNYCQSNPNSNGTACVMGVAGGSSIAANDLELQASGSVPGQPGLFFYGQNQTLQAFGDGFRCIGNPLYRLFPFSHTDPAGLAVFDFDFTVVTPGGGVGPLTPGVQWNFQFWYRDPQAVGGAGFNLSNGLTLQFTP
jgi:hypothetical protein